MKHLCECKRLRWLCGSILSPRCSCCLKIYSSRRATAFAAITKSQTELLEIAYWKIVIVMRARRRQMLLQGESERVFRRECSYLALASFLAQAAFCPAADLALFLRPILWDVLAANLPICLCVCVGGRKSQLPRLSCSEANKFVHCLEIIPLMRKIRRRPSNPWLDIYLPPSGSNPFDEIDMCASALQRRGEAKIYSSVHYSNEGPF